MPNASCSTLSVVDSPFDPDTDTAYVAWRERKLADWPADSAGLMTEISDGLAPQASEIGAILSALAHTNIAFYRIKSPQPGGKTMIRALGRLLGLERLDSNLCADDDGITSLTVVEKRQQGEYIPYTNRPLNWHTDGYYNSLDRQIRGVILHCVQPAETGGENAFLDHEIAYIQLRDENPDFIRALMAPDAMAIPPNIQNGQQLRPRQTGPVFSIDPRGCLHMRYSARARNIEWKADSTTQAAAECLLNLFQQDSPYIFRHRLEAGEGVVSNNALHCRTGFSHGSDDVSRLLYRARYFDRVMDSDAGSGE
ncbi:TfdA family taurine catabolism dioxygenase TauD [Thiogranum longum]|uniref:TfdA family taurine catabolism dioxygenase TauD n=1 Tax=Thiogranum longum TaxID=1537524 RepID=A0A4R1HDX3_9GAMM|nr:TauD/TfdA family dioxygenase [Thiogranum longum]TCK18505.1 TfdA family taurine catabolism dioxygenase TauD [Thiogranum longum]